MAENIYLDFPPLDVSGVGNIYEQSQAPLHGLEEARRKRKILQEVHRMNRSRAIMNAAGLDVSDWTQGLRAQARGIAPEQTRSQVEKSNQRRLLSDTIRTLKPRNKRQLESIIVATGLGSEWMEEATRLAKAFLYGEKKTLFNVENGQVSTVTGSEDDPRFIKQQVEGTAVPQFVAQEQIAEHDEKGVMSALQAAEMADPRSMSELNQFFTQAGREYQSQPDEMGWNPYDKGVREAVFSHFSNLSKEGELAPLWYLEEGKDGKLKQVFVMKRKGGKEWDKLILNKNAVTNFEHLGMAMGMDEKWDTAMEKAAQSEGDLLTQTSNFKQLIANLYAPDKAKKVNEFVDYASKPLKAQYQLTKLKIERNEAVQKYVSAKQIRAASDEIEKRIDFIFTQYEDMPEDQTPNYTGDVNRLIDSLFPGEEHGAPGPYGYISDEGRAEIKKRFRDELEFRQNNLKYNLGVETAFTNLEKSELAIKESRLRLTQLIAKNVSMGQQERLSTILNDAYAAYELNDGKVGVADETLGQYVHRKMRDAGVILLPELRKEIGNELSRFEKDYRAAKKSVYDIKALQQSIEGTVPGGGLLWSIGGFSIPYANEKQRQAILDDKDSPYKYPTDPTQMSAIERARVEGEMPTPKSLWDIEGNVTAIKNAKHEREIRAANTFVYDTNPTLMSPENLSKIAGTFPESGVLYNFKGQFKAYKTTAELNAMLQGDSTNPEHHYVYKTNPLDDKEYRAIGKEIRSMPHLKSAVADYQDVFFKFEYSKKQMESAAGAETPGIFDLPVIDMWKKITDKSMITQEELSSYLKAQGVGLAVLTSLEKIAVGAQLSGPQREAMMKGIHHALTVRGKMLEVMYSGAKEVYDTRYGSDIADTIFGYAGMPHLQEIVAPNYSAYIYNVGSKRKNGSGKPKRTFYQIKILGVD